MLEKLSSPFPREAISWRAQSITKNEPHKAMALAYIDARDVMRRLDEVCGIDGWQCRYSHVGAITVCEIGIRCNVLFMVEEGKPETAKLVKEGEWLWKADGAGATDVEGEKGSCSDAFKRAAVRWGIGRYLYDLESPWVPCDLYNGKFKKFTDDPWKYVKGGNMEPNRPTNGAKTAQDQYGTATKFKAEFTRIKDAIGRAVSSEQLATLNPLIQKIAEVDVECGNQLYEIQNTKNDELRNRE